MSTAEPQPVRDLPMLGDEADAHDPAAAAGQEAGANPIRDAIREAIAEHKVILFMKGTPEAPACGFSARTVAVLQALDAPFAAVDVLPDARIRQELSAISSWPTIPQLFVNGELVGGCDIVTEMYESGELPRCSERVSARRGPPGSPMRPRCDLLRSDRQPLYTSVRGPSRRMILRRNVARARIHQVSLYVGWEDEPARELEIDGFDDFYARLRTDPELPTTSQPSIGDFLAVWEPLIQAGHDIVSIHLAGGISGTYESARQARSCWSSAAGERVEVVDRETACGGPAWCCWPARPRLAPAPTRRRSASGRVRLARR